MHTSSEEPATTLRDGSSDGEVCGYVEQLSDEPSSETMWSASSKRKIASGLRNARTWLKDWGRLFLGYKPGSESQKQLTTSSLCFSRQSSIADWSMSIRPI